MLSEPIQNCFCGSEKLFGDCCGRLIDKSLSAESPEQIMRSRYSAYVLKNVKYLLQSWHKSTRPDSLDLKNDSTHWKKLKIIDAAENTVHFVAFFTQDVVNKEHVFALT